MTFWHVSARLLFLSSLAFGLSACGNLSIEGKWTLDKESTLASIQNQAPAPGQGGGLLKEVFSDIKKGLSRVLLAPFEGTEYHITSTEVRTIRNGVGIARPYEVIERPDSDSIVIRYDNGEISTWSRAEGGLKLKLPGNEGSWVYFKPVK